MVAVGDPVLVKGYSFLTVPIYCYRIPALMWGRTRFMLLPRTSNGLIVLQAPKVIVRTNLLLAARQCVSTTPTKRQNR